MTDERHERAAELLEEGLRQVEVAEEVGVTPRTIRRWKRAGKLEAGSDDGEPDRPDTRPLEGPRSNGDGTTLSDARRRKEAALATKHELDAHERIGNLVEASHLRHALLVVRRAVQAAPRQLVQDVAELMDVAPREAQPVLEEISDRILAQVGGELERWIREEAPDDLDV